MESITSFEGACIVSLREFVRKHNPVPEIPGKSCVPVCACHNYLFTFCVYLVAIKFQIFMEFRSTGKSFEGNIPVTISQRFQSTAAADNGDPKMHKNSFPMSGPLK